jgi:hypothetical protein
MPAEPESPKNAAGHEEPATESARDINPERQGPGGGETPAEAPLSDAEQSPAGPPPESIPGDSGQVPNPQQR